MLLSVLCVRVSELRVAISGEGVKVRGLLCSSVLWFCVCSRGSFLQ